MDRARRIIRQLQPEPVSGAGTGVVIVSACRTPIGSFNGALSKLSATDLGAKAIAEAMKRSGLKPDMVDECFVGNVISGGLGQAPARQAALGAGLPESVPCTTVNKVCSSGLKSVMLASDQIQLGRASVVVAGGMESMTNVPYYLPKARQGMRYGDGKVIDGLAYDGLRDAYAGTAMGNCAELCAEAFSITRKQQDDYAETSYRRAQAATKAGHFKAETFPVTAGKKTLAEDEEQINVNYGKLRKLRTVFKKKDGTVTAGNASTISDGAAALVLMDANKAAAQGVKPLARILSQADAAQMPAKFTTSPAIAIRLALERAGLTLDQVDLFEINEAFSVVALANAEILQLDPKKVNIWGGAVSIGHPLGCSGSRILVTLLHALKATGGKIGVAGICNGGGGASAVIVELL